MHEELWRLLKTPDEHIPGRIQSRCRGLELPEPLLKSVYRDNALKILNWSK